MVPELNYGKLPFSVDMNTGIARNGLISPTEMRPASLPDLFITESTEPLSIMPGLAG